MVYQLLMTYPPSYQTVMPHPIRYIASQKIAKKYRKIDEQSRNITPKVPNNTKQSQMISDVPVDSSKEFRCRIDGLLTCSTYLLTYLLTYGHGTIIIQYSIIAHNTFAIPVFITSVSIVDWTINEVKEIDCTTRKQLVMTGNFHANRDVDRFYIPRSEGGRRLNSIVRMWESRIVSVVQHLELNKSDSTNL